MNGTRIFVEKIHTMCILGTTITGQLAAASTVSVGQYLDLFDAHGELTLSTKVLALQVSDSAVETATDQVVDIKLQNVMDADIESGCVLVGMSTSSELFMQQSEHSGLVAHY